MALAEGASNCRDSRIGGCLVLWRRLVIESPKGMIRTGAAADARFGLTDERAATTTPPTPNTSATATTLRQTLSAIDRS